MIPSVFSETCPTHIQTYVMIVYLSSVVDSNFLRYTSYSRGNIVCLIIEGYSVSYSQGNAVSCSQGNAVSCS